MALHAGGRRFFPYAGTSPCRPATDAPTPLACGRSPLLSICRDRSVPARDQRPDATAWKNPMRRRIAPFLHGPWQDWRGSDGLACGRSPLFSICRDQSVLARDRRPDATAWKNPMRRKKKSHASPDRTLFARPLAGLEGVGFFFWRERVTWAGPSNLRFTP
jgi:hypothetical protein